MLKQIAIIGPTASGKSTLAIEIAKQSNGVILSLDSLAVYKQINIASAKPTQKEQEGITHFGLDIVFPNQKFDITFFFACYEEAKAYAIKHKKNLIIVGGSGFYLKALIDGISPNINPSYEDKVWVDTLMIDLKNSYDFLISIDPTYAQKLYATDSYRIEKALMIYKVSSLPPSDFFAKNPKKSLINRNEITVFEILWDKELLRKRIAQRTQKMIEDGLVQEVQNLISSYPLSSQPFNCIGIKETIDHLHGTISLQNLKELITIHTAQLAKKQRTYNKSQLTGKISADFQSIRQEIFKLF